MKIILAIFAIACIAAFLALRQGDVPPARGESGPVAAVRDETLPLPSGNQPGAAMVTPSTKLDSDGGSAGDGLLRAASGRFDRYSSVSALLRYRILMFDNELIGSGMYQQAGQGSARRYRLELTTQRGDKVISLLQVCDGETLWTYRERSPQPHLERLDLRRVRAAQSEAAGLSPSTSVEELATGGLPKLIAGLGSHFRPTRAEPGHLGDIPTWAIELEWKPSALAALVPEQSGQIKVQTLDFSKLAQIPDRAIVYLGHDDLFPRRIEFRKSATSATADEQAGQGRAGESASIVMAEFTDIRFNEPIDPRQFVYAAAGAVDVTETFLRSRGLPLVR